MATKAIRGRSKSTGQLTYFLSHGDTVILGSGNSKKKLSAKLDEVDDSIGAINTALGKRAMVQAIDSYLNTNNHMPMADVYTRSGVMMDYVVENGAILIKIPNVQTGLYEFAKFTKVSGENAFIYTATYNWAQLSDIQKKLLDLGLVTALEIVTMIPVEATAQNQLADKSFVTTEVANKTVDASHIDDNAVTTAKINAKAVTKAKLADDVLDFLEEYLADFKNTVESTAALKALTGNKNDWAVYKHTDANNNVIYSRYRYDENYNDATTGHWKFELNINSSSFTAAQWAAINSGINSAIDLSDYTTVGASFPKTTKQIFSWGDQPAIVTRAEVPDNYVPGGTESHVELICYVPAVIGYGNSGAFYVWEEGRDTWDFLGFYDVVSLQRNTPEHPLLKLFSLNEASQHQSGLMSAADKAKISGYDSHLGNDVIHVTYADKTAWNNKKESFAIPTPDPYVSNPYLPEGWRNKIPMLGDMIVQERVVSVDGNQYVVFVGGSETYYMIFTYELNSDASDMFVAGGMVSGVSGSEQYANVFFAAYPEFASCADLGGYELDEVDVENDIL